MPPVKKPSPQTSPKAEGEVESPAAEESAVEAVSPETRHLAGSQGTIDSAGTLAILQKVKSEVVGREREVREIFAGILSRKHILLEGPPGTSKSTIVRAIARSMHVPFYFIEGSIDLTPSKLLGFFNPGKVLKDSYLREYFEMGPLTQAMEEGGVLYLEEFNRMAAESANLLITPMEEGVINIPRYGQVTAKDGFTIICSQNPYDDVGTLQLSRAFLDRVVRVRMNYQSEDEEIEIVNLRSGSNEPRLVKSAVRVTRLTRDTPEIKLGASVRAAIDIVAIVQNLSVLSDGDLRPEDLADACKMALTSKIWVSETINASPEDIVDRIIDRARKEMGSEFYLGAPEDKKKRV
ncbi:MAG: MoxR family ATPase [Thermoleophilia bacterium]|nr:MoxR family ATPase [Thermoleophilia bacterium]